ncbi:hypothetical protein A3K64_01165 [Candidatus Micrarchaeota archaeon RBG_16_36_9]|nr:MAG: hypothetical protein A3K64_01165 [Candidatus Micrarchaeota archaeon RBG_16_36_9]
MRKGDTDTVIQLLGAVIIVIFIAYVTWSFIYGRNVPEVQGIDTNIKLKERGNVNCFEPINCKESIYGFRCLQISDPNFPERPVKICGCLKNEDCISDNGIISGKCGQDNVCS